MAARSYVMPQHLAVFADVAPKLHALLADGRRRFARDGVPLAEPLATWLHQLDEMVGATPATSTALPPRSDRWLTTAEAADRLGISERAVRNLPLTKRRQGGNWWWLESDVDDELDARRHVLRNPAEPSGAAA